MAAQEAGIAKLVGHVVELRQAAMAGAVGPMQQHRMVAAFQVDDVAVIEIAARRANAERQARRGGRQHTVEHGGQLARVRRLHEVARSLHFVALHRMFARYGQKHEGHAGIVLAQLPRHGDAVLALEVYVEEHQVERIGTRGHLGDERPAARILLEAGTVASGDQMPVHRRPQLPPLRPVIVAQRDSQAHPPCVLPWYKSRFPIVQPRGLCCPVPLSQASRPFTQQGSRALTRQASPRA